MCIEHHQSTPYVRKVQHQDVILPDNQVVHAANCKRRWYSLAKWQIVLTLIATNFESLKCHKMSAVFVTKVITMITLVPNVDLGGEEKQLWCHVPHTTDVWRCKGPLAQPCATADLCCFVMQKQTSNMTPNAGINVVRPLNALKHQCHLMITMTVIATIIVTRQHACKTTAPVQLNR